MSKKTPAGLIAQNKKARHYYELLEFFEAGIVLNGSEIKSIRINGVNFRDSYVTFREGEAWLIGLHIPPYANAGYVRPDPDRDRKLLLHGKEIANLSAKVEYNYVSLGKDNFQLGNSRTRVGVTEHLVKAGLNYRF